MNVREEKRALRLGVGTTFLNIKCNPADNVFYLINVFKSFGRRANAPVINLASSCYRLTGHNSAVDYTAAYTDRKFENWDLKVLIKE